ncbi:hypothetical protein DYB35_010852 [Aphanomyces astaci]|uniref:Uncharacterized protein n=1 Tax=Aphanomyces astaci TaxID=112090 RepID=A0A418CVK4_APHAT|nr:hypothetical protein DYB35_010852 [Aphanomyces astaci]
MDLFFVPTPKSMARAVLSTVAQATTALLKSNADFRNVMQAIPIFTVSPVPMTWHPDILLFMGDDPTCPNCEPKPFVQSSIAYDILCSVTRCCYTSPLIALLDLRSTSKSAEVDPICSQCPTLATSCDTVPRATTEALQLFQQLSPKSWNQELRQAQRNVMALNVMTMQYAMPLLSPPSLFSVQWPSPPFKDACLTSKRKLIVVTRQHVGEVLHDALRPLSNRSIAPIVVLLEVTMFNQPLPEIVLGLAFMAALDSCFRGLVAADKKTSLAGIVVVSGLASVAVSAYNGDAMKKAITLESYRSA